MEMFLASIIILGMIRDREWPGDEKGNRRVQSWLLAMTVAGLAMSYQHGAILQHNTARGGFWKFKFDRTQQDIDRYNALRSLIALIPPEAKVAGTERLLPHVSNRPNAYSVRGAGIGDAEYILFEKTGS